MWQLDIDATNASSGSTFAGFDSGARTTAGEDDAGNALAAVEGPGVLARIAPGHEFGRVALPKMVALCWDMPVPYHARRTTTNRRRIRPREGRWAHRWGSPPVRPATRYRKPKNKKSDPRLEN